MNLLIIGWGFSGIFHVWREKSDETVYVDDGLYTSGRLDRSSGIVAMACVHTHRSGCRLIPDQVGFSPSNEMGSDFDIASVFLSFLLKLERPGSGHQVRSQWFCVKK